MEIIYGTFGLLLTQPENRKRFWRIKSGFLAVAMGSAWALYAWCRWVSAMPVQDDIKVVAGMTLLAFSGGLWSTLLLRDVTAAFFVTGLTPMALSVVTLASFGHWVAPESRQFEIITWWILAVYVAAGFFWARWLFYHAQDLGWTGGRVSLTVRGMPLRWLAFRLNRRTNRWLAAVQKEMQLQEVTMVLVPALILLSLAAGTVYRVFPRSVTATTRDLILEFVPMLWIMTVPFIIGCTAVAEERRLNTLEGVLCLPMNRRASFMVKLAVALVLGTVLGGVVPFFLMYLARAPQGLFDFKLEHSAEIAALITGFAFYASTMSRSLLQAIPTAIVTAVVMGLAAAGSIDSMMHVILDIQFAHLPLFFDLAWPALGVALVWLGYKNFKRVQTGWRVWARNLIVILAVFVGVSVATGAIYERSWELLMSLEDKHGPARISGTSRGAIVISPLGPDGEPGLTSGLEVLLPDGRLWIGQIHRSTDFFMRQPFSEDPPKDVSGGFADGSNWVKVVGDFQEAVALQSNGTLWKISEKSEISRIGSDSDWKDIALNGRLLLAVKQDGTLWRKSIASSKPKAQHSQTANYTVELFVAAAPATFSRVNDDSDWASVFGLNEGGDVIAVKRDGSSWAWNRGQPIRKGHPIRLADFQFEQLHWHNISGTNWSSLTQLGGTIIGIRSDGSMWAERYLLPTNIFGEKIQTSGKPQATLPAAGVDWISFSQIQQPMQVGKKSYSTVVSDKRLQADALETNGTLWTWNLRYGQSGQSKRPSRYSDWIAATEDFDSTWALAADGTLSCWTSFTETATKFPVIGKLTLGPTRRPLLSTNILGNPP